MARGGLKRIAKVYRMVENIHALEARAALGAVDEVTSQQHASGIARQREETHGRDCLSHGSRVESLAFETTIAADAMSKVLLAKMKDERTKTYEAAVAVHQQSYQSIRQMEAVLERELLKQREDETRREQAASDDRFLSRREWMRVTQSTDEA